MTVNQDPEQLRADIERTRAAVSEDVNRLADTANPRNVARRQVDRVKDAATDLKDKVMGVDDPASSPTGTVRDAAHSARQAAADTPRAVENKTRGNPFAAGVIAFGAGLLISSLIPASRTERRAVAELKDRAEPVKQEVAGLVRETADNLREPAREAVFAVKDTAAAGADSVRSEGRAAATDVRDQMVRSTDEVRATNRHPSDA